MLNTDVFNSTYLFTYFSKGNLPERRKVAIKADTLSSAHDKFFDYLKKSELYSHMWHLEITCEKIEGSVE